MFAPCKYYHTSIIYLGAMTFIVMTLRIVTLSIRTMRIMTLSSMTLSIITKNIIALGIVTSVALLKLFRHKLVFDPCKYYHTSLIYLGATTFIVMTLRIVTLSIITMTILTLTIMVLRLRTFVTALCTTKLSIMTYT